MIRPARPSIDRPKAPPPVLAALVAMLADAVSNRSRAHDHELLEMQQVR